MEWGLLILAQNCKQIYETKKHPEPQSRAKMASKGTTGWWVAVFFIGLSLSILLISETFIHILFALLFSSVCLLIPSLSM